MMTKLKYAYAIIKKIDDNFEDGSGHQTVDGQVQGRAGAGYHPG